MEAGTLFLCNDGRQNGDEAGVDCGGSQCAPCTEILVRGDKRYEISNHLGNVMAIITDQRFIADDDPQTGTVFATTPVRTTDYYPFGLEMNKPATEFGDLGDYRFGFNGKEADSDSEWGSATHYDYGFRIYNPSIGKFLSVDPLAPEYPFYSPYHFAGNTPIWAMDLDGREPLFTTENRAKRIANDINAIFYSKYGDEESKTALSVISIRVKIENPDYGPWDIYGPGDDPEYIFKDMYTLKTSSSFDWSRDRYTSALSDVVNLSKGTFVDVFSDSPRELQRGESGNDYMWQAIYGYGGGSVERYPIIRLSNRLLDTKIGNRPSSEDYTIGGMFLHEYLYHLHPIGTNEDPDPQRMRTYYGLATNNHGMSTNHGAGGRTRSMFTIEALGEVLRNMREAMERESGSKDPKP